MTDDYKHVSSPLAAKTRPAISWMLAMACLVTGSLATAAWLHWQPMAPPSPATGKERDISLPPATIVNADAPPAQIVQPAQPTQPDFEFYTILPQMEVPIPKWNASEKPPGTEPVMTDEQAAPEQQAPTDGGYYLQAGSFQSLPEAETLRERIRKIGLPVEIQTVHLLRQGEWHRVRSGPFADLSTVDSARARLLKNGIHFILLKQIDPVTPSRR